MSDDVVVVRRDDTVAYDDGTVAQVRVLSVPASARFPDGLKYAFHYGVAGAEHPTIRFDNHHGDHELHVGASTYPVTFDGLVPLYRAWRAALPAAKRTDW